MKMWSYLLILGFILAAGSGLAYDIWMMGEPGLLLNQPGIEKAKIKG